MEKTNKVRKKKKLGSYPSISVVVSITLALFVIGLFGALLIHTKKLTEILQDNVEVQVYLHKNVTESQISYVEKTLSAKDYILVKDDEPQVRFISREEAASRFIAETGEDFVDFLGENPLRDAFVININAAAQTPERLQEIKTDLEAMSEVFEVEYLEGFVASINSNITRISLILISFAVILIVIVVVLINNTIKLALFSQRFLIRSMQLVGATRSFIIRPFLVRASLHGMLSAVIASGILYGILQYGYQRIEDLEALKDIEWLLALAAMLLAAGILLAMLSSYRAVKKYLRMSLDELY